MSRLSLIIKREYMSIVGRKSFIVMTLLIPVLMLLGCGFPVLMSEINGGDQKTVAVVDGGSQLSRAIADSEDYKFVSVEQSQQGNLREYFKKADGGIYAIVVLPRDLQQSSSLTVFSEKPVNNSLVKLIKSNLDAEITNRNIAALGVPDLQKKVDGCKADVKVSEIQWNDEGGETSGSAMITQLIGMGLALLAYTFVLMYGAMIMNGVIEEKTNRIVEVIVSSCKPSELMFGKIVGVGLVGLTQLLIWGVLTVGVAFAFGFGELLFANVGPGQAMAAMSDSQADSVMAEIMQSVAGINFLELFTSFILYGVGGFMLFGSLFAAFGSAVDQPNDASQFTMPIIMIEVFSLWAGIACAENPDGPLSMWCSMIPFTSPIVMMVRLPYSVPFWQLALSLAILYGTAFTFIMLASRIYRRGILMYGKKASLTDLFRWMK